jgi:DNA-binding transcriptional LysR family regulator
VTDLISRTLFDEEWMTAQRRGHPRGTGPLTMDEFCAADHLLISAEGAEFKGMVDDALGRLGRQRRVSVSIQSYALAPLILANSDCLCTLPRRFLRRFEGALDLFTPPLDLGKFHLQALWHPRMQDDAPHRWLREQVFAAVAARPADLLQGADRR